MYLASIHPATGEEIEVYPQHSDAEVELGLGSANAAFRRWRRRPVPERAALVRELPRHLRAHAADLAVLAALEMGKPVVQGRVEVEKCASACEILADAAPGALADEPVEAGARASFIAFEPLGVIAAIMPWNFPFWQVIRAAVPALLAGNAVVLKHASNVTRCALALEEIFLAAGLPHGLFSVLRLDSSRVGRLLAHPAIRGLTFTGSSTAGRSLAAAAGAALRPSVLELGGNDAYLVLEDADLTLAARVCAAARLVNSGQSCIAAKRFIVLESVRAEFQERLGAEFAAARMGNPLEESTTVGPLARADLRDEVHDQVCRTVAAGATCLLGGSVPPGPGFFYPPTLLTNVAPGMAAFEEETFGPVACVVSARSETEAIDLANQSSYGLGAAVFTRDVERGLRIATRELEAGNCFVNSQVRSDARMPFGGIRDSGWGRELGPLGLRAFVNVKAVLAD